MDWLQDMTARWTRILNSAGGGRTSLDEAVAQISAISEAPVKKGAFGRLKRNAAAPAEASAVTVLCRQLIAGVIISDLIIDQLGTLSGQSREQVLGHLSGDLPRQLPDQQLRALQAELSDSCALLRAADRVSHSGLATRIEQVLRLAEAQAAELVDAARAEAAEITSAARAQEPGGLSSGTANGA